MRMHRRVISSTGSIPAILPAATAFALRSTNFSFSNMFRQYLQYQVSPGMLGRETHSTIGYNDRKHKESYVRELLSFTCESHFWRESVKKVAMKEQISYRQENSSRNDEHKEKWKQSVYLFWRGKTECPPPLHGVKKPRKMWQYEVIKERWTPAWKALGQQSQHKRSPPSAQIEHKSSFSSVDNFLSFDSCIDNSWRETPFDV